jgi:hypothetical protein
MSGFEPRELPVPYQLSHPSPYQLSHPSPKTCGLKYNLLDFSTFRKAYLRFADTIFFVICGFVGNFVDLQFGDPSFLSDFQPKNTLFSSQKIAYNAKILIDKKFILKRRPS